MNLNDIKGAIDDLIEHHGHSPESTVYLLGEKYGINGIGDVDGKIYVLSQDGKPAVSNRQYERLCRRLDNAENLLSEAHDLLDDVHGYDTDVYHAITEYFDGGDDE